MRDHLYAKAPYLLAGGGKDMGGDEKATAEQLAGRPRRRAGRGRAPAGRHRRGAGHHRPGRAVVLHHLRRLRRAVPGRHRARRPHRRPAPLPGADRVLVPERGRRDAQERREQGQPVGHERLRPRRLDLRAGLRGARRRRRHPRRGRVPVLGRLRRRPGGPFQEGHQGLRRAAAHRRRRVRGALLRGVLHRRPGPSPRQRVPLPAAGHAERRDPQRGLRRARRPRRSSRPARTA